jgi:hypothetical protein
MQLLDDLKETRRYWKLQEEAQDRTLWRTQFGRGYGPVARQILDLSSNDKEIFTEPLPSNDKDIFTEPLPSTDKGTFKEPLPRNDRGDTHAHTYREQRVLISLLYF